MIFLRNIFLLLCLLCVSTLPAAAQSWTVGSHVTLVLRGKQVILRLDGGAWPGGKAPTGATYRVMKGSYGHGEIIVDRLYELAGLTRGKHSPGVQGLKSSLEEKRSLAWIKDSTSGALVIEDISAGTPAAFSTIILDPAKTPVLASVYLTLEELKLLEAAAYKAQDARRKAEGR